MTGTQNLVGFGGAALVFADFWFGGQRHSVAEGLFSSSSAGGTAAVHKALVTMGAEMLLVIVLTVLAGVSDLWASLCAVLIVGLWIVWAMNYAGQIKTNTTGG